MSRKGSCFLLDAKPGTWLILGMIVSWSAASHLACPENPARLSTDGVVLGPSIVEVELEKMLPLEPLWDLLLPFLGLSVGAFGIRFTLGLSFLEPMLLLAMPLTRGILRGFHDRLLSWHLGGIFGHPMLAAQLAAVRMESDCNGIGAAALGCLVGAYALGALIGAALRRMVLLADLFPGIRAVMVLLLVANNVLVLYFGGDLLASSDTMHPSKSRPSSSEISPLLPDAPAGHLQSDAVYCTFCRRILEHVEYATKEVSRVLRIGVLASDTILARGLILFGFTTVVSPTPVRRIDLFADTPLHHGFGVLWFDMAQVLTSAFMVPVVLGTPLRLDSQQCLRFCFGFALASCCVASIAALRNDSSTFPLAMFAGLSLGICAAFASAVLSLRTIKRAGKNDSGASDAAVALGWGLLASGVSQVIGAEVGDHLYREASWFGVTVTAGFACAASWYIAMLFPDGDATRMHVEPSGLPSSDRLFRAAPWHGHPQSYGY